MAIGPYTDKLDKHIKRLRDNGVSPIVIEDTAFSKGSLDINYDDVVFRNVTFGDGWEFNLKGSFKNCKFENCAFLGRTCLHGDFSGADFDHCRFTPVDPYKREGLYSFNDGAIFDYATFTDCDMSAAHLRGSFQHTCFEDCNMAYASFDDGGNFTSLDGVEFKGEKLNMPNVSFERASNIGNLSVPKDGSVRMLKLDSPRPIDGMDDIRKSEEPTDVTFSVLDDRGIPYVAFMTVDDPRYIVQANGCYYLTDLTDSQGDFDVTLQPMFSGSALPEEEHQRIDFKTAVEQNVAYMFSAGKYDDDLVYRQTRMATIQSIDNVSDDKADVFLDMQTLDDDIIMCQIKDVLLSRINLYDMTVNLGDSDEYEVHVPNPHGEPGVGNMKASVIAFVNQKAEATKQELIDFGPGKPSGPQGPNGPSGPDFG